MSGPRLLPAVESRPAAIGWFASLTRPIAVPAGQPPLLDAPDGPEPPAVFMDRPAETGPVWQATPDQRLPDAANWAASLALAAVEVVRGRRPLGQLSRWLDDDQLDRLAGLAARPSLVPTIPRGGPVRQAWVQSARAQHPSDLVAEAAVHVRIGPASVPVALRLEVNYDRWLVTDLRLC
ncbi:Rv3235 family protein [Microlunatus sp. GCM10028923]|uniref:Rv3235 family protein n=1 Tax=Microlunatus sp. GCM10028923 TaxID=3273400 RepID=UPI003609B6B7